MSASDEMTSPSVVRDLLMLLPSLRRSPRAPVLPGGEGEGEMETERRREREGEIKKGRISLTSSLAPSKINQTHLSNLLCPQLRGGRGRGRGEGGENGGRGERDRKSRGEREKAQKGEEE